MSGGSGARIRNRRLRRGWQPSSVSPQAAGFARTVVTQAAPGGRERAKNLLWAAGRLADWAIGLGLDPVPEVLLHPSVIERFAAHAPGLTGVTRRTLRTSLRFLARAVFPRWPRQTRRCPASGPRPRMARRRLTAISRLPVRSRRRRGGCGPPGWSASAPAPG